MTYQNIPTSAPLSSSLNLFQQLQQHQATTSNNRNTDTRSLKRVGTATSLLSNKTLKKSKSCYIPNKGISSNASTSNLLFPQLVNNKTDSLEQQLFKSLLKMQKHTDKVFNYIHY